MAAASRIGIVGVGRMGANIGRRLHETGYPVAAIYDANQSIADEIARELGAESVRELARVTAASDVILTVVTDDAAMRKVFATTGDSLLTGASGKI
ncbi:MAG TPA: NAD(P)-binding domain-containing protein, partial [Candidatus Eremiobacteraceae bacterium]|nr:NAD(P)-binding domain-containing protein [Candidatus Eremiobacteraceae bacterium]